MNISNDDVVGGWVISLCKKPAWGHKFLPLEPPDPNYRSSATSN